MVRRLLLSHLTLALPVAVAGGTKRVKIGRSRRIDLDALDRIGAP